MMENERVALALIALITGIMGFVESMTAVPAASTAMAADALSFVQHSISAGFLLWATAAAGRLARRREPATEPAPAAQELVSSR